MAIDFVSESTAPVSNATAPTGESKGIDFQIDFQPETVQPKPVPKASVSQPKTFFGDFLIPDIAKSLTPYSGPTNFKELLGATEDTALGLVEGPLGLAGGLAGFMAGVPAAALPAAVAAMPITGLREGSISRGMEQGAKTFEKVSSLFNYQPTSRLGNTIVKAFAEPIDIMLKNIAKPFTQSFVDEKWVASLTPQQKKDLSEGRITNPKELKEAWAIANPKAIEEAGHAGRFMADAAFLVTPGAAKPVLKPVWQKVKTAIETKTALSPEVISEATASIPKETPPDVASAALEALRQYNVKKAVAETVKSKFEGNQSIAEGLMVEALKREGHAKGALSRVSKIINDLDVDAKTVDFKGMKGVGPKSQVIIEKLIKERDSLLKSEVLMEDVPISDIGPLPTMEEFDAKEAAIKAQDLKSAADRKAAFDKLKGNVEPTIPEKLSEAVGKPAQVKTLEQMGVTDPTVQVDRIIADAVGQKLDLANGLSRKGKLEAAEKVRLEGLENAKKLRVADGPITEAIVNKTVNEKSPQPFPEIPKTKEVFKVSDVDVKYDGVQKFGDDSIHLFTIQEGNAKGATLATKTLDPLDISSKVEETQRKFDTESKIISEFDSTTLAKGEGYEIKDKRRFDSIESAQKVATNKGPDFKTIKIGDKYAVGKYTETPIPEYSTLDAVKAEYELMSEIPKAKALVEADHPEGPEFGVAKVGDKYYRTVIRDPNAPIRPNIDFVEEVPEGQTATATAKTTAEVPTEAEPTAADLRAEEAQLKALLKENKTGNSTVKETIRPELADAFSRYKDRYVDKINVAKVYHGTSTEFLNPKELVGNYLTPKSLSDIIIDVFDKLGIKDKDKTTAFNKIKESDYFESVFNNDPTARPLDTKELYVTKELAEAQDYAQWAGEAYKNLYNILSDISPKAKELSKYKGDEIVLELEYPGKLTEGDIISTKPLKVIKATNLKTGEVFESKPITKESLPVVDDKFATFKSDAEANSYKEATGKKGEVIQDPLTKEYFIEPELEGFDDLRWEDGMESLTPNGRSHLSDETLDYGSGDIGSRDIWSLMNNERGAVDITPLRIHVEKVQQVVEAAKKAGKSVDEFLDMIGMSPDAIEQFKVAMLQLPKDQDQLKKLDPITSRILTPTGEIVHQTVKMNKAGEVKSVLPPITKDVASKIMNASRDNIWGTQEVRISPSGREVVNAHTSILQRYLQATETRINAFRRFGIPEIYRDWRELKTNKERELVGITDEIKLKKDSLTKKERKGLAIAAYADMKGGKEAFETMGITEADIPIMNAKQVEVFNWMTQVTSKMLDRVNYVRVHTGQKPIPRLLDKNGKENYLPLMRQMNVLREMGVLEGITTADSRRIASIASDYQGIFNPHFKVRKVSDIPIELDVFKALESYLNYTLEEIYIGPLAAQVKEIASVPLPRPNGKGNVMLKNHNPALSQLLLKWSDEIMGIDRTSSVMAIENPFIRNVAQTLSKNIVVGIIGGSLQTFMKQPTALVGIYANTGMLSLMYGAGRYMIEKPFKGKQTEAQRLSNSLHIRKAELIWNDFIEQMQLGTLRGAKAIAAKVSFVPMDLIDSVVAEIGWNSGFSYAKGKLKLNEKEAAIYADDLVERTQGMGTRGAVSPIQSSIATKWLTLLQTFGIADFNYILQDIAGVKNPDITSGQQISRAFRYILGTTIVGEAFEAIGMPSPFPSPIDTFMESQDEGKGVGSSTFNAMMEFTEKLPVWGGSAKYGSSLGGVIGEFANDVPESAKAINGMLDWGSMTDKQKLNASMLVARTLGYGMGIPMTNQILKSVKTASRGGDPYQVILGVYIDERNKRKGAPNFKLETPKLDKPEL
jgi:hypothetical protein